eukprot:6323148-Pyramimonas_sp.AAC.1
MSRLVHWSSSFFEYRRALKEFELSDECVYLWRRRPFVRPSSVMALSQNYGQTAALPGLPSPHRSRGKPIGL